MKANGKLKGIALSKAVEKKLEAINDELTDKASALMNMAYALGCAVAPILGG